MEKGVKKNRVVRVVVWTVLVLIVLAGIYYFLLPKIIKNSVCVTRSVIGNDEKTITLDVETSFFKRPSSFIIEERFPAGWELVSSQPKGLFASASNKMAWLFWDGGDKPNSVQIIYTVKNASSGEGVGKIFTAKEKGDPSAGYNEAVIAGTEKACV